jgi:hypothetical protein
VGVEEIYVRFDREFRALADAAFRAGQNLSPPVGTTKEALACYHAVTRALRGKPALFSLCKADCDQELRLLWLEYYYQFRQRGTKPSKLKNYLLRRSIWGLRDWLRKEARVLSRDKYSYPTDETENRLDLQWLVKGPLAPYERYVLYKLYREGLSESQLAKQLRRDWATISRVHKGALGTLRRYYSA